MKHYQLIIGLEIHVELKTQAKMFCQCPADYFGRKPNIQTCPVCLGLPGALPVPNRKAVEWTMLIGKALNCQINKISKFDRKHYFYPDLPKGYQISQYDQPIATKGWFKSKVQSQKLKVKNDNSIRQLADKIEEKIFRIRRVHLEEDTGKLIHSNDETLIDFNRSGVPLVEIVTDPDFDNSDDVKFFLEELQVILRYLDVSDCDMEKGTMRLEPNISIKVKSPACAGRQKSKVKSGIPSYKVEIKNINSFKFVKQAIDYEIKRQIEILEKGEVPVQETRGFNEKKGITYSQRTKEEAHDYRYFPEPDIPAMVFNDVFLSKIVIPELPQEKLERYVNDFKIKYESAYVLIREKKIAEYFEEIKSKVKSPACAGRQKSKLQLKTKNLYQEIANFIINKKISTNIPVEDFIKKAIEKLTSKTIDEASLNLVIDEIIKNNSKAVEDYKKGKQNVLMFLVGQVMKELKGQADAQMVKQKLEKIMNNNK